MVAGGGVTGAADLVAAPSGIGSDEGLDTVVGVTSPVAALVTGASAAAALVLITARAGAVGGQT